MNNKYESDKLFIVTGNDYKLANKRLQEVIRPYLAEIFLNLKIMDGKDLLIGKFKPWSVTLFVSKYNTRAINILTNKMEKYINEGFSSEGLSPYEIIPDRLGIRFKIQGNDENTLVNAITALLL